MMMKSYPHPQRHPAGAGMIFKGVPMGLRHTVDHKKEGDFQGRALRYAAFVLTLPVTTAYPRNGLTRQRG